MTRKKETIYGAEKIAKFFGVTKDTAREWCKKGKLPGFKIGKEWKVRVEDLQKMIERKIRTVRQVPANVARLAPKERRRRTRAPSEDTAPRLF
jgi:excisionase family DNA binding protein